VLANGTRAVRWDEILRAAVRSNAGAVGSSWCGTMPSPMWQVCGEFLDDEDIDAIDWPSCSHTWIQFWIIHRDIHTHQITPQTVQDLTGDTILYLIMCMTRHCLDAHRHMGAVQTTDLHYELMWLNSCKLHQPVILFYLFFCVILNAALMCTWFWFPSNMWFKFSLFCNSTVPID